MLLLEGDGATLVYKLAANSASVAGSLRAAHPGGTPFWSFGGNIESFSLWS